MSLKRPREETSETKHEEWSYYGKVILAPMVRAGTLPLRKLAIEYGADMVYSEEIIDKKIAICQRSVDPVSGHISFRYTERNQSKKYVPSPVFVTYPNERVVFQMGSSSGPNALRAAQVYIYIHLQPIYVIHS